MATRVPVPVADGGEELEAVTLIAPVRRAEFEATAAGWREGPAVEFAPALIERLVGRERRDAVEGPRPAVAAEAA